MGISRVHDRIKAARMAHGMGGQAAPVSRETVTAYRASRRTPRMVAAMAGAGVFLAGVALGMVGGGEASHTARTGDTVAYVAPTNGQDDQHGPLRAPNDAEMRAYGQALETAYGTCSLEWHGTDGGSWTTICLGPNPK